MKKSFSRKLTAVLMAVALLLSLSLTAFAAELDKDNLQDGTYKVKVYLWNASKDKASMAADAIQEDADLTVTDGKYMLTIYPQEMSLMGIDAYLQELQVEDANGELQDIEPDSLNDDGNPVSFTFEVQPGEELTNVEVNPHVAMMGNSFISARIKVDYDTLEVVELAETDKKTSLLDTIKDTVASATEDKDTEEAEDAATADETDADDAAIVTDKLEDGVYEVPVALWNASKDQASMAADSLLGTARIVVKDGDMTMYIYTQEMTMGTVTASLQELKVDDGTGTMVDATVETKDADGNPTCFSFPLYAVTEYLDVEMNPHVELVDNQWMDARIKMTTDKLTKVSDDTNVTKAKTGDKASAKSTSTATEQESNGGFNLVSADGSAAVDTADNSPLIATAVSIPVLAAGLAATVILKRKDQEE